MRQPYVFLLTDAGRVESVNVNDGIKSEYLYANAPMLDAKDIVSLVNLVSDNGLETVVAVNENGEKIDLAPLLRPIRKDKFD